jgi:hypothetical protein
MRKNTYEAAHAALMRRMRAALKTRDIRKLRKTSRSLHRIRSFYPKRFPRQGAA